MGGEKSVSGCFLCGQKGSPPHGRGKVTICEPMSWGPGITPAWAGKSARPRQAAYGGPDHPRMGGEKVDGGRNRSRQMGSPPHGRGKVIFRQFLHYFVGITPAWAGKSRRLCPSGRRSKDHPRMGGEKTLKYELNEGKRGSPPHGRGKVYLGPQLGAGNGITPAWAGKSPPRSLAARQCEDHPRMGGEKISRKKKK